MQVLSSLKFLRGGARKKVFFKGNDIHAAIVTCGGLCPGLNVVIRSIVLSLWNDYEARDIWGIKWGFRGFYEDFPFNWVVLDPEAVKGIH